MELAYHSARWISAASFLLYGVYCLVSPSMVVEFERYRLPRLRVLTGSLEILGAVGLIVGARFPALIAAAALGLALLMVAGILTRVRIGDPVVAMLPAGALLVLNAYVCAYAWAQAR